MSTLRLEISLYDKSRDERLVKSWKRLFGRLFSDLSLISLVSRRAHASISVSFLRSISYYSLLLLYDRWIDLQALQHAARRVYKVDFVPRQIGKIIERSRVWSTEDRIERIAIKILQMDLETSMHRVMIDGDSRTGFQRTSVVRAVSVDRKPEGSVVKSLLDRSLRRRGVAPRRIE